MGESENKMEDLQNRKNNLILKKKDIRKSLDDEQARKKKQDDKICELSCEIEEKTLELEQAKKNQQDLQKIIDAHNTKLQNEENMLNKFRDKVGKDIIDQIKLGNYIEQMSVEVKENAILLSGFSAIFNRPWSNGLQMLMEAMVTEGVDPAWQEVVNFNKELEKK